MPVDFSLNQQLIDIAAKEGFDLDYTKRMFEKFRSHHQAMGSVRADWTSAWRYWVHSQVDLDAKAKAKELERSTYIDGRL